MSIEHPYASGELDREIVLSRVINAPRDLVYRAWIEPGRMFDWFGPTGFRCSNKARRASAPHGASA